jgi:hypothetical protein
MTVTWPQKDPNDIANYSINWSGKLASSDTVASSVFTVELGGLTILQQSHDSAVTSTVRLSGGTVGVGQVLNHIVTANGDEFDETAVMVIAESSSTAEFPTGYTVPTVAQFLAAFPEFAGVVNIGFYIQQAERSVDTSWTEGDYAIAIAELAAHLMAVRGLGTDPDSQANSGQMANFQLIRSGQLTLQRKQAASGSSDDYYSTRYGCRYLELLGRNKPAVQTIWRQETLEDNYWSVPFNGGFGS